MVEALGFAVDVAARAAPDLQTAPADHADSDEVPVQLFQRASTAPVAALNPVARFSRTVPLPFGHYEAKRRRGRDAHEMAQLVSGQNQMLNPDLEAGRQTSFDPGAAAFGLWVKAPAIARSTPRSTATAATNKHAARVFPLRARGGAPVPNAYLVAFEESNDGDYQDVVFVLWNVKPAPAPKKPLAGGGERNARSGRRTTSDPAACYSARSRSR